jgi:hypothetical protein
LVDRWASAPSEARAITFEAAFAIRQVEIGLAGFLSLLSGLTLVAFGVALLRSVHYPRWLGLTGLLDGLGIMAAGAAQASTGFSGLSMAISMPASSVLLVWIAVVGALMWRLAPRLADEGDAAKPPQRMT